MPPLLAIKAIGLKELQRSLKKMPDAVDKTLAEGIEAGAHRLEAYIVREQLSGQAVHVHTNRLRGSVHTMFNRKDLVAVVGTNVIYAKVASESGSTEEPGGVITPKRAKVLTIPTRNALTATGKPRGTALQFKAAWDTTFWKRFPDGRLLLLGRKTEKSKLVTLFIGVRSVKIRARRVWSKAWVKFRPIIVADLRTRLDRYVVRMPWKGGGGRAS